MRITCPCCGALHELDTLVQHEYARRAVAAAAQLPPALFAACMRYLRLFVAASINAAPQRALTMDRAATLLDILVQAINAGKVEAKGRNWSAPLAAWPQAFEAVFERADSGALKRPLKSHAYLFGVISNLTNAEEAKAETATEQARASGSRRVGTPCPPAPEPAQLSPDLDEPTKAIPAFVEAALAKLTGGKSMAAATAKPAEDTPAADPLLGVTAQVIKGKWKGRIGQIVRVLSGDELALSIHFARNGERVITFDKSELSL
jgi:hypothetical protein